MNVNEILSKLDEAKAEIIFHDHVFQVNGKNFYKLFKTDATYLKTGLNPINKDNQIDFCYEYNSKRKRSDDIIYPNEFLLDCVTMVIEGENYKYSFPANTYFIEQFQKSMNGQKIAKFNKYIEVETAQSGLNFTLLGTFDKEQIKKIKKASSFVATDLLRPRMNFVIIKDGFLVAMCDYILYKKAIDIDFNIEIDPKAQKFLKSCKSDIEVYICQKDEIYFKFVCKDKFIITQKYDRDFPAYENLMNVNTEFEAECDTKELKDAISLMAITVNQASNLITLNFDKRLKVTSQDIDFDISGGSIVYNYSSNFLGKIRFNAKIILKALNTVENETVKLRFAGPNRNAFVNDILIVPMYLDTEKINFILK